MFELGLYVSQKPDGTVLGLADHHHEIDETFGLEHEPDRYKDVEMGRFGVAARPLEYRLQIGGVSDLDGCRIMKGSIVHGTDHLSGGFVAQGEIVGKIILAESGIVVQQTLLAPVLFGKCLVSHDGGVRDGLYPFAVLFPLFVCQFLFRLRSHRQLPSLFDSHLLGDV